MTFRTIVPSGSPGSSENKVELGVRHAASLGVSRNEVN